MGRPEKLFELAQKLANEDPEFLKKGKGAGKGNKATNKFIEELKKRAKTEFGCDRAQQGICGDNNSKVDFYFPEEETIVEVALSLWNAGSEFEKDIIKAILAKVGGYPVTNLLLISRWGAQEQHKTPLSESIISWVKKDYKIDVEIKDIK